MMSRALPSTAVHFVAGLGNKFGVRVGRVTVTAGSTADPGPSPGPGSKSLRQ
jgi:hypothetical protein